MPGDNIQSVGGGGGAPVVTSVNGEVGDVTVTGSGGVDSVDGQTGAVDLTGTYLALAGGTLVGALVGTLSTMTTAIRAGAANWSSTGEIRLPSTGAINFRAAANNADLSGLSSNASDQLQLGRTTVPSSDSALNLGASGARWATVFGVIGSFGGTTPSTSGALRLNNTDTIGWRNAANSGNIAGISVNASDQVVHGATTVPDGDNTRSLGTSSARWSTMIGVSVQVGTNPAATGSVRIASTGQINWRNAANSGDIGGFSSNASDQLQASTTLVPSSDSAKDLGATALRWANIFGVIGVFGSATNVASAGALRMANTAAVNWRNAANSADLGWTVNGSNQMVTTAELVAPDLAPASTTGATVAARYFRGTTTGAPASGTWVAGDIVPGVDGTFWHCTVGGTPGTWVQSGSATYPTKAATTDLIDAAGDLLVGTADNTLGKLAKGTGLQVLRTNAGATALEWATPSGLSARVEPPFTAHPLLWAGNTVIAANQAYYQRIVNNPGSFTISKIGVYIGVSSGNLSVALLRGTNGVSGPTTRVATSGAVASPGTGWNQISLGGSFVVDPTTDWFGLSADNTTIAFGRFGGAPGVGGSNVSGAGLSYRESAAHPIPSTPAPTTHFSVGFIMYGVA